MVETRKRDADEIWDAPEYIAMRKREYTKTLEEVHQAQTLGVPLLSGNGHHRPVYLSRLQSA